MTLLVIASLAASLMKSGGAQDMNWRMGKKGKESQKVSFNSSLRLPLFPHHPDRKASPSNNKRKTFTHTSVTQEDPRNKIGNRVSLLIWHPPSFERSSSSPRSADPEKLQKCT